MYWLALLNSRDQYHAQAAALASRLRGPFITTDAVLLEVANALSRAQWRSLAVQFLESVFRDPNVQIVRLSPDLFDRAAKLYAQRPDKEWSLTDCVSFTVMQDRGIAEALTADRDFVQAGFQALLV